MNEPKQYTLSGWEILCVVNEGDYVSVLAVEKGTAIPLQLKFKRVKGKAEAKSLDTSICNVSLQWRDYDVINLSSNVLNCSNAK